MPELKTTGSLQPFEKEYFRKDGTRVPVLIGAATFEEGGNQGVAFVLDLTERKRAEAAARESEQRCREVQTELAHANRNNGATIGIDCVRNQSADHGGSRLRRCRFAVASHTTSKS
jgi:PAS domain-containing protein